MSSRITYCKDIYYFQVILLVPAKGLKVPPDCPGLDHSKTGFKCVLSLILRKWEQFYGVLFRISSVRGSTYDINT